MSALPKGWVECVLGDLVELKYGKALPEEARVDGPFSVFGSNGVVGRHAKAITAPPTIIVGRKGSAGKVSFSEQPCFPIDTTYYVDAFDTIDPGFAKNLLDSLNLGELDRSTAIPGLNREQAYKLPVLTPPLAEQRRIAAKIDRLSARSKRARGDLERVPKLLEKYKRSLIDFALSGSLTADWRTGHDVKSSWSIEEWSDAGETINGKAFPSGDYSSSGIPLLRPGNLHKSGNVEWNERNTRYLPESYREASQKHYFEGEELVINLTAQSLDDEFLGRACLTSEADRFLLNQRIALFRPRNMIKKYCLLHLKSSRFRSFVDNGLNSGSLIQHVHTKQMARFIFHIASLPEQLEIVRRIEQAFAAIDRLAAEATSAQKLLDRLDQAVPAKAFRGELVPQDPNDEPASVLLARIRAERAAAPAPKRGRKPKTVKA